MRCQHISTFSPCESGSGLHLCMPLISPAAGFMPSQVFCCQETVEEANVYHSELRWNNNEGSCACCGRHSELVCADCVNVQHIACRATPLSFIKYCPLLWKRRDPAALAHRCSKIECILTNVYVHSYVRSKPVRHQCVLTGLMANLSISKVILLVFLSFGPSANCLIVSVVPPSVSAVSNICFL